ncbi:MAG: M14 family zinc carboxypeptidase [Gemmatimonadales bacterium]
MTRFLPGVLVLALAATPPAALAQADGPAAAFKPGRSPNQPVDEAYTKKIREYTTEPFFLSPLVDYLPASRTVPTPMVTLGDIAGAPNKLPYSHEVYAYMRLLEKASPRVKVVSIGTTEEGREMIAVAVASEAIMANLEQNRRRLAQLADPRTIGMDDARAARIVSETVPVYYITGTIHSPEAGAPTALMELAYRLAVDESPYVKNIRDHLVTLITPIVEVDGRDRQVDVFNWHMAHPNDTWPGLLYWGKYVAHDNNRDAMGMTLKLSQNVLNAYVDWKAQVIHDLHESVPYLYDNTIGDGPYNAWIDPLLANEWQMIGWNNVQEMTRYGMPGVFAFGNFDTWSPGYLMFMAATHNGISRLYETFGNGGSAETLERTLSPNETARTWYKQNPPLPRVMWSLRNNNNYEQTGLLVSLSYFANNRRLFLQNFYEKSKRSILKARTEGPAAYVLTADERRPGAQAELLRVLQRQHVEISRATNAFTVELPGKPARGGRDTTKAAPKTKAFPAGSFVIRMDQPFSRIADALLDYQYWSPNDPQRTPYDDTGWTFPEGYGVEAVRVTDAKVFDVPTTPVTGAINAPGGVSGRGAVVAINHNGDNALATLRYRLRQADIQSAEAIRSGRPEVQPRELSDPRSGRRLNSIGPPGTRTRGGRSRRRAVRGHAPRPRRPGGHDAHLAEHPDRGLVAPGIRFQRHSVRLHQRSGRRGHPDLAAKWDVIIFAPGGGISRASSRGCRCAEPDRGRRRISRPISASSPRPTTCDPASAWAVWRTSGASSRAVASSSSPTARRSSRSSSGSRPVSAPRTPGAGRRVAPPEPPCRRHEPRSCTASSTAWRC